MYLVSRIEEAKLSAERFGNLAWVGSDVWRLRCDGNQHLHEEVARRNICSIK